MSAESGASRLHSDQYPVASGHGRKLLVLVRCRFLASVESLKQAGADAVVSEEQEASGALLRMCERVVQPSEENGAG